MARPGGRQVRDGSFPTNSNAEDEEGTELFLCLRSMEQNIEAWATQMQLAFFAMFSHVVVPQMFCVRTCHPTIPSSYSHSLPVAKLADE